MADRSIRVILRAEIAGFKQAMDEAAASTKKVGTGAEGSAKKADTALGRMVQSATQNREAWTTVGTTLTGVGAAITAVGVAALKTGISYNTLQQQSRAALTTLLGSAQAANAQMDKLDAFARTSPFAKQTFITAQQQMLAFGIESKKVIPYLDAIQNAVAAAGGSNQQLEEVAFVISQIGAAGKITAVDLMQLGQRGINAAELIGSQMGKTGAQVREDITAGALDAGVALDALAAGMQQRFAGAADGVKDTFAGAMDRVKAAWRDFASELAAPLVDPDGGGALVGLLNWAADAMRWFGGLPDPIKNTASALGGAVGVATLLAGGFALLAPRAIDTYNAFVKLAPAGGKVRGVLAGIGKAAPIVGAAIVGVSLAIDGMSSAASTGKVKADQLASAWDSASRSFTDAATQMVVEAIHRDFNWFDDVKYAGDFSSMADAADMLSISISGLAHAMLEPDGGALYSQLTQVAHAFSEGQGKATALAKTFGIMLPDESQVTIDAIQALRDKMGAQSKDTQEAIRIGDDLAATLQEGGDAAEGAAESQGALTQAMEQQQAAAEAAAAAMAEAEKAVEEYQNTLADAASKVGSSAGVWSSLWSAQEEAADKATESADRTSDAWQKAFEPPSMDAWIEAMQAQAEAFANFSQNALTATSQLRTEMPKDLQGAVQPFTAWLMEQGPEALATFVNSGAEQREALVRAWAGTGDQLADQLASEVYDRSVEIVVTADGAPALKTADEVTKMIDGSDGTVTVYGYTGPVERSLLGATAQIDNSTGTITIAGADGKGRMTLRDFIVATDSSTGVTTITGNDEQGRRVVTKLVGDIGNTRGTVGVDADTSAARSAINAFLATLPTRKTINVDVLTHYQQNAAAIYSASGGRAYTGMRLPAFSTGGRYPGIPPADPRQDNLLGVDASGFPRVLVRSREWVVNEPAADYYGDRLMGAINARAIPREALAGVAAQVPALAGGGPVGNPVVNVTAPPADLDGLASKIARIVIAASDARTAVQIERLLEG